MKHKAILTAALLTILLSAPLFPHIRAYAEDASTKQGTVTITLEHPKPGTGGGNGGGSSGGGSSGGSSGGSGSPNWNYPPDTVSIVDSGVPQTDLGTLPKTGSNPTTGIFLLQGLLLVVSGCVLLKHSPKGKEETNQPKPIIKRKRRYI